MRYPILLVVLGLLSTYPITNFIHGQIILPGSPVPVPVPLGQQVASSGYGSTFGILALAILVLGILPELLRPRNTTPTTPAPGCPSAYFLYSTACGRFCYRYESKDCKSWSAARTACRAEGGDLLAPSECSYQFFRERAQQNEGNCSNFWLGGATTTPGSNFLTVRGEPISNTFSFWGPGQPNGGAESCIEMAKSLENYLMSDDVCSRTKGFICQIFI